MTTQVNPAVATAVVTLIVLLVPTSTLGQEPGYAAPPRREVPRDESPVAGCPRTSQEFYPCAKTKSQAFNPPRLPDGTPDMQGAWNASTTTGSQNIQEHPGDNGFFFRATKTLIVDPADGKVPYQPWAAALREKHLEEYIDPFGTCYEATMDDPKVFARPWTMAFPLIRMPKGHEVMEEACHEGDHSVPNLLSTGYKIYIGVNPAK